MHRLKTLFVLAIAVTAPQVFAQAGPGWNVGWGLGGAGVPVGPWASILIALSLGIAAVGFLRRRSGTVASLLIAAAMAVGVYGYSIDRAVAAVADIPIDSPSSGVVQSFSCSGSNLLVVNNLMDPVTLQVVQPFGFTPGSIMGQCVPGTTLAPMAQCDLPCPLGG